MLIGTIAGLYVRRALRLPIHSPRRLSLGAHGIFWVRDFTEVLVLWEIFADQCYEHELLPSRAASVIDLGCNVGATLVWLHRRYPDAAVVGLEADPLTSELAQRNTADIKEITVDNMAVSAHTGVETLWRTPHKSWAASSVSSRSEPAIADARGACHGMLRGGSDDLATGAQAGGDPRSAPHRVRPVYRASGPLDEYVARRDLSSLESDPAWPEEFLASTSGSPRCRHRPSGPTPTTGHRWTNSAAQTVCFQHPLA